MQRAFWKDVLYTGATGAFLWAIVLWALISCVGLGSDFDFNNNCKDGRCDVIRDAAHAVIVLPARVVGTVVGATSSAYQEALASAQYRAANRIHGHSQFDTHRTSGVGWATSDSSPTTCLGRGGEAYAVARGVDGWYATKFTSETTYRQTLQVEQRWSNPINLQTVQSRRCRLFRRR